MFKFYLLSILLIIILYKLLVRIRKGKIKLYDFGLGETTATTMELKKDSKLREA